MLKHLKIAATVIATGSMMPLAYADSTLVYELTGAEGSKTQHTITISGSLLRLESKPKGKSDYTVMDTGRMLMFEVDDQAKSFQVTRMGRLYWPATALNNPNFMPVPQKQVVSGVRCQQVKEMAKDPKLNTKHCMTAGGPLGLNAREMITLSRLFMSARRIGLNWLGVATLDERQVSILSQAHDGTRQEFKTVVHGHVANKLLKIPNDYKRLKPDLPPPLKKDKKKKDKKAIQEPASIEKQSGSEEKTGKGLPENLN
ncbi:MAG: hypothetical protein QNL62_17690 [Gammaproteobacteria bacterium]|nr:hypothetical protein [Gammaproteobacteria bacterium]